jgi:hypothetical protein
MMGISRVMLETQGSSRRISIETYVLRDVLDYKAGQAATMFARMTEFLVLSRQIDRAEILEWIIHGNCTGRIKAVHRVVVSDNDDDIPF